MRTLDLISRKPFTPRSLPGIVGLWTFEEGAGTSVPNRVATATPTANLLHFGEQNFNAVYYSKGSTTAVDNNAANPNGVANTASTLTFTASAAAYARLTTSLPAGTYTASIWLKTSDASNQVARLSYYTNAQFFSTDFAVTGTWTKFSYTFTAASTVTFVYICNGTAAVAYGLNAWDFRLVPGSTASDQNGSTGDIVFPPSTTLAPTWSNGGLTFDTTATRYVSLIFSQPIVTNKLTLYLGLIAYNTTSNFSQVIAWAGNSLALFAAYGQALEKSWPRIYYNASLIQGMLTTGNMTSNTRSWRVATIVADGTRVSLYLDGLEVAYTDVATTAGIATPITLGSALLGSNTSGSSFRMGGTFGYMALYTKAHSVADIRKMSNYIKDTLYRRSGIAVTGSRATVVFEGDSITSGTGAGDGRGWSTYAVEGLAINSANYAIVSSTIFQGLVNRAPAVKAACWPDVKRRYLVVFAGTNDVAGARSAATVIADLKAYCADMRAAGLTVYVVTMLPRNAAGFNATRATINTEIRVAGNVGVSWDGVIDFAADATMGVDGAELNTTYYGDGVHPTGAGHAILGGIASTFLSANVVP